MDQGHHSLASVAQPITMVGGGRMGSALLASWLDAGLPPARIEVVDPYPSDALRTLAAERGFTVSSEPAVRPSQIVVLAVKPQALDSVAAAAPELARNAGLTLSIMAGIRLSRLRAVFPGSASIVRAMPNLPAAVGRGVALMVANETASNDDRRLAESLLKASGHVEWFDDEALLDAGTALSGSGPGYLFYVVECLAEAGERAGLPPEVAVRLARWTVEGAGALLAASPKSARELREDVTSPGGTTEAGLAELVRDRRLSSIFADAVLAATTRSRELA